MVRYVSEWWVTVGSGMAVMVRCVREWYVAVGSGALGDVVWFGRRGEAGHGVVR